MPVYKMSYISRIVPALRWPYRELIDCPHLGADSQELYPIKNKTVGRVRLLAVLVAPVRTLYLSRHDTPGVRSGTGGRVELERFDSGGCWRGEDLDAERPEDRAWVLQQHFHLLCLDFLLKDASLVVASKGGPDVGQNGVEGFVEFVTTWATALSIATMMGPVVGVDKGCTSPWSLSSLPSILLCRMDRPSS